MRASFDETATFMNAVMLVRFFDTRSVTLHNLTLVRSTAARSVLERLADREELAWAIERYFEIPRAIVREAMRGLGAFDGVYG